MLAAQQGIHRRQLAGNGNVFDESQVHRHIAIAALPGVITAVYQMQHMGVQQVQGNNSQGQHTGPQSGGVRIRYTGERRAVPRQPNDQRGHNSCGQQKGRQPETQYHRKTGRNKCQQ